MSASPAPFEDEEMARNERNVVNLDALIPRADLLGTQTPVILDYREMRVGDLEPCATYDQLRKPDFQRETAEKDREYDSTASALEGKRELNAEETARLKQLWKKLVRMFHPDLHEHDPEKRKTYELLTQAINEARDRGDIELLELIAKDPQAFILKQGWASVSLDVSRGLMELRSLYEHLQARILELIETLDEVRASADYEVFRAAEQDESVIGSIVAAQREELEREIGELKTEAERIAGEARELVGEVPF